MLPINFSYSENLKENPGSYNHFLCISHICNCHKDENFIVVGSVGRHDDVISGARHWTCSHAAHVIHTRHTLHG